MKFLIVGMNLAVLLCVAALWAISGELGWQFAAGVIVGTLIYQCAHRVTYGCWFD